MKIGIRILVAAALVGVVAVGAMGQVKKGKTRAATTKQLMVGLVQPNCAALDKGTGAAPPNDKGWQALATNAALLNEAGYLLMDDGRCPDSTWANAAKTLRECSAEVLAKVEAKDQAGAAAAFKALTQACADCHAAHRQ